MRERLCRHFSCQQFILVYIFQRHISIIITFNSLKSALNPPILLSALLSSFNMNFLKIIKNYKRFIEPLTTMIAFLNCMKPQTSKGWKKENVKTPKNKYKATRKQGTDISQGSLVFKYCSPEMAIKLHSLRLFSLGFPVIRFQIWQTKMFKIWGLSLALAYLNGTRFFKVVHQTGSSHHRKLAGCHNSQHTLPRPPTDVTSKTPVIFQQAVGTKRYTRKEFLCNRCNVSWF